MYFVMCDDKLGYVKNTSVVRCALVPFICSFSEQSLPLQCKQRADQDHQFSMLCGSVQSGYSVVQILHRNVYVWMKCWWVNSISLVLWGCMPMCIWIRWFSYFIDVCNAYLVGWLYTKYNHFHYELTFSLFRVHARLISPGTNPKILWMLV
jgi:hypothetical protein